MTEQGVRATAHDAELDASGLACPMPLLKAKLALNGLGSIEGDGNRSGIATGFP